MKRARPIAVCLALVAATAVAPALAQKISRTAYADNQNGFEINPPDGWDIVPVQPLLADLGMLARIESREFFLDLLIVRTKHGGDGERESIVDRLGMFYGAGIERRMVELEDEEVEIDGLDVRHRQVRVDDVQNHDVVFDVWSYPYEHHDIELVFTVPADDNGLKRWLQTFKRCAKTFEVIETSALVRPDAHSSYEAILAFHAEEAARTPGWRAIPTPSQKYVIKTSSDNQRFLDEVIERLELSREIYERDFPPKVDMDHVSVVRVCATREEFHKYGGTSGGVAGWFNPASKELVLYDGKNIDRNMSYAVMSHEAFHQYCHFLFDQSEAHRWFDEGHGDYYGGAEFSRGRAEITPRMPAGLDRLSVIREMVTQETYAPLADHLNYSHAQWQGQGPSNVSCYAQSWSIVYFLRKGTLGEVSRRVWKEEYADIIPNYVEALFGGFKEAYEEARRERAKEAADAADGGSVVMDKERPPLPPDKKKEIWEKAYEASWGRIDLRQFQEDWLLFVKKYVD